MIDTWSGAMFACDSAEIRPSLLELLERVINLESSREAMTKQLVLLESQVNALRVNNEKLLDNQNRIDQDITGVKLVSGKNRLGIAMRGSRRI